jgi:hypothetical protein
MFPKQNWKEKYFKRKPSVYGNIDQPSYAVRSHLPVTKPDLWKERNAGQAEIKEPIIGRKDHVYFVINTAVGVGGKGMDRAKK